ncbi:hypothetical protein D3C75_880930 [compost metagenome]
MLAARRAVILVTFPVHDRGAGGEIFARLRHCGRQANGLPTRLAAALRRGVLQQFHTLLVAAGVGQAIATQIANIGGADRGHGLDPLLGLSGIEHVTATTADAQGADTIGVHWRKRAQEIYRAADVIDARSWKLHQARLAATVTLIGRIVSQGDKALLGQSKRIQACGLLFDAADRVRDDDGRVLFVGVEFGRFEQVGSDMATGIPVRESDPLNHNVVGVRLANHRGTARHCWLSQGQVWRDQAGACDSNTAQRNR